MQDQGVSRAMLLLKAQGKDLFWLLSQLLVVPWPVKNNSSLRMVFPLCVCVCVQIPLFNGHKSYWIRGPSYSKKYGCQIKYKNPS